MNAVIYARYSSDSQREESIEGQLRECTAFAEKNGITILRHYIDRAFSAKTDNRPEFQNMIKDSGKKLFDIVMRKIAGFVLCMIMTALLAGCGTADLSIVDTPNALVPAIMYEGHIYCTTGKQLSGEVDSGAIAGEITSVVPLSQWPEENGEANFGETGDLYALADDAVVVRVDNVWTLFEIKLDE